MVGSTISAVSNNSSRWNSAFPVVPTLDTRVAEVLAPNRKNCVEQAVDCLGVHADARLPLEDELTEDGNGFENSWKHYVTLARQAADESALLGREFRDAKLNQLQGAALAAQRKEDQRQAAGNALQEVQNMCGTALDTNKLLDFLSRDSLTGVAVDQKKLASLVTTGPACPVGKCVVDLTKLSPSNIANTGLDSAELKRFQDCIDDSSSTFAPFVTLGNRAFCVYQTGNEVCPAGAPCFTNTCAGWPMAPAGTSMDLATPLGYFTDVTGSSSTGTDACRLLRIARGTHDQKTLDELAVTGVFNIDRMRQRVGPIGFRAEYGGFFAITQNKTARLSSGSGIRGRSAGWPWSGVGTGCGAPDNGAGLFCSSLGASPTPAQIGAFNSRVYRAVFAGAAAEGYGAEIVGPSQDDASNANPCTGEHETEYHGASASSTFATPLPVWTCKGRIRDNLKEQIKYSQSVQPRAVGSQVSWILPDGTSLGNTLNIWGTKWPRCVWYPKSGGGGGLTGKLHACYWGYSDGPGDIPPTWYESQMKAQEQIWAGLSNQSMFAAGLQGRIYEVLRTTNADLSQVFYEGGADNEYLSKGIYNDVNTGDGHFYYYRIPLDAGAVLDGLEVLCELDKMGSGSAAAPAGQLDLTSVDLAGEAIKKLADAINDNAAKLFFAHVPKAAADEMAAVGPTGAFPALSGEMGEAVSDLRQGFLSTQHALPVLSNALRSLSTEMQALRVQLEINQAQKKIIDYDTLSSVLNQVASCAESAASPAKLVSFGVSAISCANSAAQIVIALQKSGLQQDILAGEDQKARIAFMDRMSQNATALEQASLSLMESREAINASLSRIDGLKKRAKLAIGRALYLESYHSEAQAAYDTSVGSLEALSKKRFDQSLKNAKLMSWYAKRAIEQRLGVALRELREDLPLVQAPALWEGEACSYSGFQDLVDPNAPSTGSSVTEPADGWVAKYGNGFIGDYVTKLENFVESYRLDQNFHEGKDTAVVSLRDDVANVRARCSLPARNLFKSAGDLLNPAWAPRFCDPVLNGSVPVVGINCISAVPRVTGGSPPNTTVPDLAIPAVASYQDSATGYTLKFGDGKSCVVADSGGCGWKPGSALSQIVNLQPGQYRVSWYTRDDPNAAATIINGAKSTILILRGTGALAAPTLVDSVDAPLTAPSPFVFGREGSGTAWKRASEEFKVVASGDYEVGFGVPTGTRPAATPEVTIAAPMLEAIRGGRAYVLGTFQDTDAEGMAVIADCEDTDGSLFRLNHWKRNCMRLCSDGFSANCKVGPEQCFQEFDFNISQAALQNGKLLNYSGFARGNFNYRIESLGVNFVGSNVRNCEDAALPSTCYNAGFVPYSLQHNGPFFVRNRGGDDFQALLFDGRIEHARGLALERYFTSPISSTDRDLMADYMRTEFSGRPLDGSFALRVWDDQGIDFSSIQDVQVILNYRYWTAFD
jgi:hypothetical protein